MEVTDDGGGGDSGDGDSGSGDSVSRDGLGDRLGRATATRETLGDRLSDVVLLCFGVGHFCIFPADDYGPLGPVVGVTLTGAVSNVFDLGWGALAVSLGMQPVGSLTRRGSTAASGRQLNIETGARERPNCLCRRATSSGSLGTSACCRRFDGVVVTRCLV